MISNVIFINCLDLGNMIFNVFASHQLFVLFSLDLDRVWTHQTPSRLSPKRHRKGVGKAHHRHAGEGEGSPPRSRKVGAFSALGVQWGVRFWCRNSLSFGDMPAWTDVNLFRLLVCVTLAQSFWFSIFLSRNSSTRFEEGIREVMLEGGLGWRVQVSSHMAVTDLTVRGTRENFSSF